MANYETLNKGEWSEVFALLRTLSDGILKGCNARLEHQINDTIPFIYLKHTAVNGSDIYYHVENENIKIINLTDTKIISRSSLNSAANIIFDKITNSNSRTFRIIEIDNILEEIQHPRLKSPTASKSDLIIAISEKNRFVERGFSVKSNLGANTSLVNASKATNFLFEISSVKSEWLPLKAKKLVANIPVESIRFIGMDNTTYHHNLQLIDLQLPQIIAFMLIHYFRGLSTRISDLLAEITHQNPLSLSNTDLYRAKIEEFLVSSALGMVPTQEWNRLHSADGGMMIVKESREVVTFYCINAQSMNYFRQYLIENCYLDTASTTRHGFGRVYDDNKLKLNLLVRL
jgi:hypothetical protein